jgi:prepilin-type N-terminal cleavage/methylation domain-containing protein
MSRIMMNLLHKHDNSLKLYGFTLLELMIVLAIIAALVTVTVPYATKSNKSLKIKQDCMSMAETIRYAVDLAIDTKKTIRVVINLKTNSYLLEAVTGTKDQSFEPIEGLGDVIHYLSQNMHIIDMKGFIMEGQECSLVFEPARPWPNATISLSSDDSIKTIKITGRRVEIEDSTI